MEIQPKAATAPERLKQPASRGELREWVRRYAGLTLPWKGVCEGHDTPLDYLDYVFFERGPTADTVVWACRGGGKTTLGAVATLLDLLFKPGIQIKILGGSREQSLRMYDCLRDLVERAFADQIAGKVMTKGFTLANGSKVEILTQSQRSVRGTRVQKMRCDELELFDPRVWSAAQLTTRSLLADSGGTTAEATRERIPARGAALARGAVEVFSTLHRPAGLMAQLVQRVTCPLTELPAALGQSPLPQSPLAQTTPAQTPPGQTTEPRRIFRWCIWDVVARCPEEERSCEGCELAKWCQSRARHGEGFVTIDDVLQLKKRTSRSLWETEMLCHLPVPEDAVFPAFGPVHQRPFPGIAPQIVVDGRTFHFEELIAGIDYGWKRFVCLWVALLRDSANHRAAWVVEEYVQGERDLPGNIAAVRARAAGAPGRPALPTSMYYADVAGRSHDHHTGATSEALLKAADFPVKSRGMPILTGIHMLAQLIEPPETWGQALLPRLWVDPRCTHTIAALTQYRQKGGEPIKDGTHDHLVDALRYAVVGQDGPKGKLEVRTY